METGATIAFGSDYPFGSLDPIAGLHTAINHFHPSASLSSSSLPLSIPSSDPHLKSVHHDHNFDLKVKKLDGANKTESNGDDNNGKEKHGEESCRGFAVFRPEEKIGLREALHYYTLYVLFFSIIILVINIIMIL